MNPKRASTGRLLALAGIALMWSGSCLATGSLTGIARQAVLARFEMSGSRVVAKAMPLDPRLHLAPCAVPPRSMLSDAVRPAPVISVPVQCPQPGGWIVRIQVSLQLYRPVLVTNRPLMRGDGLRPGDVHLEQRDVTRLGYGYLEDLRQAEGRTLARALPSGSVVTPFMLAGRNMVSAGDHVVLVANMGGIVVRADGIALGSGDDGARLRVRNQSSGRVVDAMVDAPGVVQALP